MDALRLSTLFLQATKRMVRRRPIRVGTETVLTLLDGQLRRG